MAGKRPGPEGSGPGLARHTPREEARGVRARRWYPAGLPVYPRSHNAGTFDGSQPVRAV